MKKIFGFFIIVAMIMTFSVSNAIAWSVDLSDSETDPYTLDLNLLVDDGETFSLGVYQLSVILVDGYVSATHETIGSMFQMENPHYEGPPEVITGPPDEKIGDWCAGLFPYVTTEDLLIGTVTYDYEVTAGVDILWNYDYHSFGGLWNDDTYSGLELYDLGYLTYNGVNANPVPVPAAIWLLGSGLVGILGIRRKKNS